MEDNKTMQDYLFDFAYGEALMIIKKKGRRMTISASKRV